MLVASIDVGTRNCALVVYDSVAHAVLAAEVVDLCRPTADADADADADAAVVVVPVADQNVVYLCAAFVRARATVWAAVDVVAVEKQLSRRMLQVQYVLEAQLTARGVEVLQVAPRSVKLHFGLLGRGNHAANKRRAVAAFTAMLGPGGREQLCARFPTKRDDVADAVLQALFVAAKAPAPRKKRGRACGLI
jgi:hypothetical protein